MLGVENYLKSASRSTLQGREEIVELRQECAHCISLKGKYTAIFCRQQPLHSAGFVFNYLVILHQCAQSTGHTHHSRCLTSLVTTIVFAIHIAE